MPKKQSIRSGRIMNLATELSIDPRSSKSKIKTRHYDHGHTIQLSYRGNTHNHAIAKSYGTAFAVDQQEVRSFDTRDDRFFVESFESADDSEINQHSTINQEIEGVQASSFAMDANGSPEEIEQHNNLNLEIEGPSAGSMAFNTEAAAADEVIQYNTLNEEQPVSTTASYSRGYNTRQQEEQNEYSPAVEERQIWNEPPPVQEQEQESLASQSSFEDDIKAILSGQKLYDATSKSLTSSQGNEEQDESAAPSSLKSPNKSHAHDFFDNMAKGMSLANAYDFGTLSLEKSFDEFDRMMEKNNPVDKKLPLASEAHLRENKVRALNDLDWAEDFSSMAFDKPVAPVENQPPLTEEQIRNKQNAPVNQEIQNTTPPVTTPAPALTPEGGLSPVTAETTPAVQPVSTQASYVSYAFDDRTGPDWPARPTTVRILSDAEKQRIFGRFEYEPTTGDDIRILGTWVNDNIVDVRIPQLDGKIFGGRAIPAGQGTIRFHRLAQNKLVQLWQAWERAGLLDRILSFQGGFVPRFVRNTAGRNPRPLSNHAWGTAFDINAPQNRLGVEPALLGQTGCVRELVEIANQHGFFWGGHYRNRRDGSIGKDGMHFEIAHPFNP